LNFEEIDLIEEIQIGEMPFHNNGTVFDGRIPKYTKITQSSNPLAGTHILNYGGSNINQGTHLAFFGNELIEIKKHLKNVLQEIYLFFPNAVAVEHKASIVRKDQILFRDGRFGFMLKKLIREHLDPNKVIATTAMLEIDGGEE